MGVTVGKEKAIECNRAINCDLANKIERHDTRITGLEKTIIDYNKIAEEQRNNYREKQDKVLKYVEKMDRTIHGEDDSPNNGMIGVQNNMMATLEDMRKVHYIPKFFHDMWTIVKKPLIITFTFAFLGFMLWLLAIYLTSKNFPAGGN